MVDLSLYPITRRWPPQHLDRLQLYSLNTPNGVKASIMLEECGIPYEAHLVDIGKDESHSMEFRSLNPNAKIPAILDPDGPGGEPLELFESGAILLYLAEKTGRFMPTDPTARWHTVQWLMFQMGGVGPMFGQVGFFHRFAGADWPDPRPLKRYVAEAVRLLDVMDLALDGQEWFIGSEYTIADISMLGWVRSLVTFYEASELVDFERFENVAEWLQRGLARPAVQRGLRVPWRE